MLSHSSVTRSSCRFVMKAVFACTSAAPVALAAQIFDGGPEAAPGSVSIMSVEDIVSLQKAEEPGKYDVICTSGSFEKITEDDLKRNNVCPNIEIPSETHILTMQKLPDGTFQLICNDLSRVKATASEIREGKVCQEIKKPAITLKAGTFTYKGSDSWFCSTHVVTPNYDEQTKQMISVSFKIGGSCSGSNMATIPCTADRCEGTVPWSGSRVLQITGDSSYSYGDSSSTTRGEYVWQQ